MFYKFCCNHFFSLDNTYYIVKFMFDPILLFIIKRPKFLRKIQFSYHFPVYNYHCKGN